MSLDLEAIQARWELWLGHANWVQGQHLAAAAREDVPALLAHCRAQAAEIERLRSILDALADEHRHKHGIFRSEPEIERLKRENERLRERLVVGWGA